MNAPGLPRILEHAKPFLMFATVGAITTGIYFLALAVQLEIMKIDYRIAVTLSYLLGVTFHFFSNKFFTFRNRQVAGLLGQTMRYALLIALNYVITMLLVMLVVEKLGKAPYVGVLLSVGITVVTGYFFSRYWIFKAQESI